MSLSVVSFYSVMLWRCLGTHQFSYFALDHSTFLGPTVIWHCTGREKLTSLYPRPGIVI